MYEEFRRSLAYSRPRFGCLLLVEIQKRTSDHSMIRDNASRQTTLSQKRSLTAKIENRIAELFLHHYNIYTVYIPTQKYLVLVGSDVRRVPQSGFQSWP